MLSTRHTLHAAAGFAALALAVPAAAQDATLPPLPDLPPMGDSAIKAPMPVSTPTTTTTRVRTLKPGMTSDEIKALPAQYRRLPVDEDVTTKSVGADGVETITRTRRIVSAAPVQTAAPPVPAAPATRYVQTYAQPAYAPVAYPGAYPAGGYAPAAAPMVLNEESWIEECERRTRGRNRNDTGKIIGGLLGAIGGGVLGNRLWDSERLAGTLIGGGVGGLAGAVIGGLFGGGKKKDLYDCEAALNTYLEQYGQYGAPRVAARVIPAPAAAPVAYPAYGYGYAAQPTYYQPAQTVVMVPVTTYQQQRVVVRETVREETYEVPAAARTIPPAPPAPRRVAPPTRVPSPSPKLIKRVPAPAPSPKMIKGSN